MTTTIQNRLEELRQALRSESISQGELCELQSLSHHIGRGDVELLEAAGVSEFIDISITVSGVAIITSNTDKGSDWLSENVTDAEGEPIYAEQANAEAIALGALRDGLRVEVNGSETVEGTGDFEGSVVIKQEGA